MSGIDEQPVSFDMVWPMMLEKIEEERIKRGWTEIEYTYYKMLARFELSEEIACQGLTNRK